MNNERRAARRQGKRTGWRDSSRGEEEATDAERARREGVPWDPQGTSGSLAWAGGAQAAGW
eukprot:2229500-Pleurochrysis_carterae.AAC.1